MIMEFVTVMTLGFAFGSSEPTMPGLSELNPAYGTDVSMPVGIEFAEAVQIVKAASTAADAPPYQFGVCEVIRGRYANDYKTVLDNEPIYPDIHAKDYAMEFSNGKLNINQEDEPSEIIIVQSPTHGAISRNDYGNYRYTVDPDSNFVGYDYAILDVKFGDKVVRIHYVLSVNAGQPEYVDIERGSEITIVQYPEHGTLEVKPGGGSYRYIPDSDFVGTDHVIFEVRRHYDDTTPTSVVRIPYDMTIFGKGDPDDIYDIDIWGIRIDDPTRCPQGYWKISLTDAGASLLANLAGDISAWQRNANLSELLVNSSAVSWVAQRETQHCLVCRPNLHRLMLGFAFGSPQSTAR